jgi:hypothetical protein
VKTCTVCKKEKSITSFSKDGRYHKSSCKECVAKWVKSHRGTIDKKDLDKYNRKNKLKAKYNLTEREYEAMHTGQHSVCAMCKEECNEHNLLSVDHCHSTGIVRGLLCARCNKALGVYEEICKIAETYLAAHGAGSPHLDRSVPIIVPVASIVPAGMRRKLTEEDVREIRYRYKSKIATQAELARTFSTSYATINSIVSYRTWKHVI